jgi:hypothetical protein
MPAGRKQADESEMPQSDSPENALRLRWVETWRRAGEELERLREKEIASIDTQEAVRQIFGSEVTALPPAPPTSGLVEQQAWFAQVLRVRRGL